MPKFSALPPLQKRLTLILGLAFVCQLLPFVSRLPVLPLELAWLVDLTTHWQLVWLTMSGVATAILSVQRRSIVPWVPFVLGASLTWFATQPGTLRISQGPHETLTVVSANLHVDNPDLSSLHNWLNAVNPDIVVLQEVSPASALQLKKWSEYETISAIPADDPFGMAVLVRGRPAEVNWRTPEGAPPYVQLDFQAQGTKVRLFGIHPMPPISAEDHFQRSLLMRQLVANAHQAPTLVVGDFNASPWSSAMPKDTLYRVLPLIPTWRYILPIDLIMGTSHWKVVKTGRGPAIGSDHFPVWAILTLD